MLGQKQEKVLNPPQCRRKHFNKRKEGKIDKYVSRLQDSEYLISMVSVESLLRFGYTAGLNEKSCVLVLCCGYGTVLKLWSETFGISGVGVDINQEFINKGKERLLAANLSDIDLICGDVTAYRKSRVPFIRLFSGLSDRRFHG